MKQLPEKRTSLLWDRHGIRPATPSEVRAAREIRMPGNGSGQMNGEVLSQPEETLEAKAQELGEIALSQLMMTKQVH